MGDGFMSERQRAALREARERAWMDAVSVPLFRNGAEAMATAREALEFYADDKNYRMNAPLGPNSSWFTGSNMARTALAAMPKK